MKKVVLASLLACAAIASGLPSASAQTAPTTSGAPGQIQMSDAEYAAYNNAITQTTPQAKSAGIESYLTAFPQSSVKLPVLVLLMQTYSQYDAGKTMDAAGRVLQLDPNNLQALTLETFLNKAASDTATTPDAKQAALDTAAGFAQKGLAAAAGPKPAAMSDADFKTLQSAATPIFLSAVGADDLGKKDQPGAIKAYQQELAGVPVADTQNPAKQLQDTYYLTRAYLESVPPDYLSCAFYGARFVAYAPEPYKSQVAPTAKFCYKKFHGVEDGYETFAAAAQANLTPPADLFASVKPAPTPAEKIHGFITGTPDLGTLAISDKEMVFQYGSPEDSAKVWDTIKGKSVEIPDALVIASTPTQLQVAVSEDAVQSKTADFTFNLAPAAADSKLTPAAEQKHAAQIAAATAVGSKVTLTGTYESFTPSPLMITMSNAEVVLKAAGKAAGKAPVKKAAPAHRAAHR